MTLRPGGVPEVVSSPEDLAALVRVLSPLQVGLLERVVDAALSSASVPLPLARFASAWAACAAPGTLVSPGYRPALQVVVPSLDAAWGGSAESLVWRVCLSLYVSLPAAVRRDLLDPFRLVVSVPEEWISVVVESIDSLGLERALTLPGLVPVP